MSAIEIFFALIYTVWIVALLYLMGKLAHKFGSATITWLRDQTTKRT